MKSVNNQRRHNLYSQSHHYQTLTTEIMAPFINTVWPWMFLEISTYHESRLRLYIVVRIIFWQWRSLYSQNLTILLSEFNSLVLDSGGLVWSAAGSTCKVKISQPSTTSTQAGKSNRIKIIGMNVAPGFKHSSQINRSSRSMDHRDKKIVTPHNQCY